MNTLLPFPPGRWAVLAVTAALSSCGGGGDAAVSADKSADEVPVAQAEVDAAFAEKFAGTPACPAPADGVVFDVTRGFTWDARVQQDAAFAVANHLRCLGGVSPVTRDLRIDTAALGHAAWLVTNNVDGHRQVAGTPGFTGMDAGTRMRAAGYPWTAWGEVVSRSSPLAIEAIESLTAAIYHRIAMLGANYQHAGVGMVRDPQGRAVAVVNYGATSATPRTQRLATFPAAGQTRIPVSFDTDTESPDPAADLGVTGYPVSIQGDPGTSLQLRRFELWRVSDGTRVTARVRGRPLAGATGIENDAWLGTNAAFLLPVSRLAAGTEYEARVEGVLDGVAQTRTWRFRTRDAAPLAVAERTTLAVGEHVRVALSGCSARYSWSWGGGIAPSLWSSGWMQVRGTRTGSAALEVRDTCGGVQRINLTVR